MTRPKVGSSDAYGRFVAVISGASGLVFGAATGALAALAQSPWPLVLLIGYLALRFVVVVRRAPSLTRLWRWWSMPLAALGSAGIASFTPMTSAPFVLVAAVIGFVVWIIAYGLLDARVDSSGEHGAGWL